MTQFHSEAQFNAVAKVTEALAHFNVEEARLILAHVDEITEAVHGGRYLSQDADVASMQGSVIDIPAVQGVAFKRIDKRTLKALKQKPKAEELTRPEKSALEKNHAKNQKPMYPAQLTMDIWRRIHGGDVRVTIMVLESITAILQAVLSASANKPSNQ